MSQHLGIDADRARLVNGRLSLTMPEHLEGGTALLEVLGTTDIA